MLKYTFLFLLIFLFSCVSNIEKNNTPSDNTSSVNTPSPYIMDIKYSMTGKVVDTVIYNAKNFQIIFTDSSSIVLSSVKYNINYFVDKK